MNYVLTPISINVVNVFSGVAGGFGNPVGIIVDDAGKLTDLTRQQLASSSGFSECVFLQASAPENIRTYTPKVEIPFAGHAAVGAAWFIHHRLGQQVQELRTNSDVITVDNIGETTWVQAAYESMPPWNLKELSSAESVNELEPETLLEVPHTVFWASMPDGDIRARTFASDWGIPEDEANGSGCMLLAKSLDRQINVHHGAGSLVMARPVSSEVAAVGGAVTLQPSKETTVSNAD